MYSREAVTTITDLEQRVEDLTAEVEQLEAEKAQLTDMLAYGRSLTPRREASYHLSRARATATEQRWPLRAGPHRSHTARQ